MVCPTCFRSGFRLSRLRRTDLPSLITLRFPVRCRACDHRMYAGPIMTMHLWQDRKHKRRDVQNHQQPPGQQPAA